MLEHLLMILLQLGCDFHFRKFCDGRLWWVFVRIDESVEMGGDDYAYSEAKHEEFAI